MRTGLGILILVLTLVAGWSDGWAAPSAPRETIACAHSCPHPAGWVEEALDPLAEHRLRERVLRLGPERTRLVATGVIARLDVSLVESTSAPPTRRLLRPRRAASASRSPSAH